MKNLIAASILAAPLVAQSQNDFPISTDRPSFSDGTGIIPRGRGQIETGFTLTRVGSSEFLTLGEGLFRIPLNDQLELRLSNFGFGRASGLSTGFLDSSLGLKYRFQVGTAGKTPDLALVVQTTLPSGARDYRVDRSQPTLKFAGYYQATPQDGLGWNVVWSNLGPQGAQFDQWALSGYWARTINPKTATFVEVYHLTAIARGGPNATFADAGVTYLLNPATQVDFRIGTGFNQRRDGWFLGAGVAFRF